MIMIFYYDAVIINYSWGWQNVSIVNFDTCIVNKAFYWPMVYRAGGKSYFVLSEHGSIERWLMKITCQPQIDNHTNVLPGFWIKSRLIIDHGDLNWRPMHSAGPVFKSTILLLERFVLTVYPHTPPTKILAEFGDHTRRGTGDTDPFPIRKESPI